MTTQTHAKHAARPAVLRCPGCDGVGLLAANANEACLHCGGAGLIEAPDRSALKAHIARDVRIQRRSTPFQPTTERTRYFRQP